MRQCARRRGAAGGGGAHGVRAPRAGDARAGGVSARGLAASFVRDAPPHQGARRRGRASSPCANARSPIACFAELAARGPLARTELHDGRRGRQVWGAATLAKKRRCQKTFFSRPRADRAARLARAALDPPFARARACPPRCSPRRGTPGGRDCALAHAPQAPPAPARIAQARRTAPCGRFRPAVIIDGLPAGAACPPLYCLREDAPLLSAIQNQKSKIEKFRRAAAPRAPRSDHLRSAR